MNLPNTITAGRLVLTAVFVVAVSVGGTWGYFVGLWSFVFAAISDFLDGYLARKLGQVTSTGKLMDPLADKVLVAAAYVFLVSVNLCPAWVAIVILAREFLVTGLRQIAVEQGMVLAADRLGKWKTGFQIAYCITGMVWLIELDWNYLRPLAQPDQVLLPVFLWGSLLMTVLSGGNYLKKSRELFRG